VTSVITYFSLSDPTGWPAGEAIDAVLNIYPKTGSLPMASDDPTAGTTVLATLLVGVAGFELVADSLSIDLTAGDYWVGLTPSLDFGAFGQEFHQGALAPIGDNTAARNPGEGFALGPDWFEAGPTFGGTPDPWDGAITIEGIPTPGALALIGVAGFLGSRRRRRV
jgi:MYXO-CTERM domain-containing protein